MAKLTLKQKCSREEFKRRAAEVLGRLSLEVGAFADVSPEERLARKEAAREDPFAFFTTYLPHYFPQDFAPFHHELVELLDRRPGEGEVVVPVAVAAPREFAKTTLTSFGYVLHQICFGLRHFIIIGSDTEDLASDLTGYIYLELLYNERIRADFGDLVRDNWAVDDFVTLNDVRLKARGRGQRLRGLKHKQWRPDLVVLDDLESDKQVKNPRLVRELLDWVQNAVYPGIDAGGNLFWIGTILAKRSALNTVIEAREEQYQHWVRRIYRAITETGESLWPARHPLDKLLQQKKVMGSFAFNREKMNNPVDDEGVFQEGWIRYYHPSELAGRVLLVAAALDPSLEVGSSADYKGVITVGLDAREMVIYVLDAFIRRASLEQTINAAFQRREEHGWLAFGVETNLFQRLLIREFDREARERKTWLPIREIENKTAKETRIAALSAHVERGQIRFCRGQGDQDLLLEQLLYFPSKTVHDDGPDALEMAVRLALTLPLPGTALYESLGKQRFEGTRGCW